LLLFIPKFIPTNNERYKKDGTKQNFAIIEVSNFISRFETN